MAANLLFLQSHQIMNGLCRDGIRTNVSEQEADLYLLKSIPKGLHVHRCAPLFGSLQDSISIYIYYEYKHMLLKLCMNKCRMYRRLAKNFQAAFPGWQQKKPCLPSTSRNSTTALGSHRQTSVPILLMEKPIPRSVAFKANTSKTSHGFCVRYDANSQNCGGIL